MKKILYSLFVGLLIFTVACEDDPAIELYDGAGMGFVDNGITTLDPDVTIDIYVNNPNVSQIVANLGGNAIATISVSKTDDGINAQTEDGSHTFTQADLGLSATGDDCEIEFEAQLAPINPVQYHSIELKDPISISGISMLYQSDVQDTIAIEVTPKRATVTSVTVDRKIGVNGTYAAYGTGYTADDEIYVTGTDYTLGDTVYLRVNAAAGALSTTATTSFVVVSNTDLVMTEDVLLTAAADFDLVKADTLPTSKAKTADIEFLNTDVTGVGFESNTGAMFAKTSKDGWLLKELDDVVSLYADSVANAVDSLPVVMKGDYYAFKVMRGTKAHYGVIKITDVNNYYLSAEDNLVFDFKLFGKLEE